MDNGDPPLRRLSDEQLRAFDHDTAALYSLEPKMVPLLTAKHPDGRFRFLDLGGGNGNFTDRVLNRFPSSEGTVLDVSEMLLARNQSRPNKRCKCFDLVKLASIGETYDVVFCNWVLHHIITGGFLSTRKLQQSVLAQVRQILAPSGAFIIVEELKNGFGGSDFPNALIFHLTKPKILSSVMRRLGANTAGVGVAFFGEKSLTRMLESVFPAVRLVEGPRVPPPRLWKHVLTIRSLQNAAVFYCQD